MPPDNKEKDIIKIIRQHKLFANVKEEDIRRIIPFCRQCVYPANTIIFSEGDPSDAFYFIVEGEVLVTKHLGPGERQLRKLFPGDCFGELGIIIDENRTASIKTISETKCFVLDKNDFNQFLQNNKELANSVMSLISSRMTKAEELAANDIIQAYKVLIFSLSDLAESRDEETGSHLYRVRDYCKLLAECLASTPAFKKIITPWFIESIYGVSPLHDIGKVAIPDAILLKPGKLTKNEFEIIKSHTWMGASTILKVMKACNYPTFQMGYNITHYHHERYDGSGYPARLKGEEIPVEARIMSLADVYDALLSNRPYKRGFSYEKTHAIIKEGMGTQFDPLMTEIMSKNMDGFDEIHRRYS